MVQQLRNGDKPSIAASQHAHQALEFRMQLSALEETVGEVGVNDADATLGFQPLLIVFPKQPAKPLDILPVTTAEPGVHPWLGGVMVRHGRIYAVKVDLAEHEIARIADVLPTEIAPEIFRLGLMTCALPVSQKHADA